MEEVQKQHRLKLTPEERQFKRWKKVFDWTPIQYQRTKFQLFRVCLSEFDEAFPLHEAGKKKLEAVIKSVLSKIDPEAFDVTIDGWKATGGVASYQLLREQELYAKALELNFSLRVGFCNREKLISYLRVHSGEEGTYFQALGIQMAREVETGRGPVDYTFNYGFTPKIQNCHLEIKLSYHSSLPEKFMTQLETYTKADSADAAIFLVIRVATADGPVPDDTKWTVWREKIRTKCQDLGQQRHIPIRAIFIDALKQPSASNVSG
jgi:hypothetical protein